MGRESTRYPHVDEPAIFKEALRYSEAETGFTASLIEKDYYCSIVLKHFFTDDIETSSGLIFKGGTCLGKVYADFYRLSEDLDFALPMPADTTRPLRRKIIGPVKKKYEELQATIPGLRISSDLAGHNESKQYIGYIQYTSVLYDKLNTVKIEISLREPLLQPSEVHPTRTIALNPFTRKYLLQPFDSRSISRMEAYAEKARAALSRREPAIRDFFDLYYARKKFVFDFTSSEYIDLVQQKIAVPGNGPIDVSIKRKEDLVQQVDTQLKSVLREKDYSFFDLNESFDIVTQIAGRLN
jgi:predicted nucleotidyltransferase component of viral defense system